MNDTQQLALLQGVYVVMVGGAQPSSRGWGVDGGEMWGGQAVTWVVPAECNGTAGAVVGRAEERHGRGDVEEERKGKVGWHRYERLVEAGTDRRFGGGLGARVGGPGWEARSRAELMAEHAASGVRGNMQVMLTVGEGIAGGLIGTFTVC